MRTTIAKFTIVGVLALSTSALSAQPTLRGATLYETDANGNGKFVGTSAAGAWRTNTPVSNVYTGLFLTQSSSNAPTSGQFLNNGLANLTPFQLAVGDNAFYFWGSGTDANAFLNGMGMNLWFGNTTIGCADAPNISAFTTAKTAGAAWTSDGTFGANGASQTDGQCSPSAILPGANTLSYLGVPGYSVTLTAFSMIDGMGSTFGGGSISKDVVASTALGADGAFDTRGTFSLRVTQTNLSSVPEPSTYALMGVGLVGLAIARRRKTQTV